MIRGISFRSGEAILYLYYHCNDKNVIGIPFLVPNFKSESKILKGIQERAMKKMKALENMACNSRLNFVRSLYLGKNKLTLVKMYLIPTEKV